MPRPRWRVWRRICVEAGVGDPFARGRAAECARRSDGLGFDAAVEFPPIGHAAESIAAKLPGVDAGFRGNAFRYANLAADYLLRPRPAFTTFRGVTPMWDNTARRQSDGMIVAFSTPALFGAWTTHALEQTRRWHEGVSRLLFVNAWNEWAEGNHLEPDALHGRGYLEALRASRIVVVAARAGASIDRGHRRGDSRSDRDRHVARSIGSSTRLPTMPSTCPS